MPNIIMADAKSEMPNGAYVKIHTKECVIEENNGVTNTVNFQTYLMTLSGLPGTFLAFTASQEISNPVNNDIACAGFYGILSDTAMRCYRYRAGTWSLVGWNSGSYEAVAVPGRKVIVYTKEIVEPT